ncbi:MAG: WD40 repeat domain-containing protein [Isosphaeraceae bacterium]
MIVQAPVQPPFTPNRGPDDAGLVKVGGDLDVDGVPRGAGKSISPPRIDIGEAKVGEARPPTSQGEVRRLTGHTDQVMDLVLSPDGRTLVTGGFDCVLRVWDMETGTTRHELKGNNGPVCAMAMSPDGHRVLSGGADRILRLWDIDDGRLIREFYGHGDCIFAISFTPDGRRCLSAGGGGLYFATGNDHSIWFRDLEDGRVLARWAGHTGVIDALAVSPDCKLALSSSSDQTARLWDIAKGRELRRFPGQPELALHAIFSPDGRRAIVTSAGHLIRVFNVESGQELLQLRGHNQKVDSLATTMDGRILASGSWPERTFRFWDLTDGRPLGQIALDANPQLGTFTPDGRRVIWSFSDKTVREFAVPDDVALALRSGASAPGEPLVVASGGKISDVTVGGGGRYLLLTLKESRELAIFDVSAAAVVKRVPLASSDVLVAAGAKTFVIAYPVQRLIERWDLATMARRGTRLPSPIRARLTGLAMGSDSDGPILAVWSPDAANNLSQPARFSFLELGTLKALKARSITLGGMQGIGNLSALGGSFELHPFLVERLYVRASACGDLFAIWQTRGSPSGVQTLAARRGTIRAVYNHDELGYLAPGPDGLTMYTGLGGPRGADGKPVSGPNPRPPLSAELTFPSSDPAYYLSVRQQEERPNRPLHRLTASVHAADGTRLLTVWGLDEMNVLAMNVLSGLVTRDQDDSTVDKRFHLLPAARLLITLPPTNDRLVLRRLDIEKALDRLGSQALFVKTPAALHAKAGVLLEHQMHARSQAGGVQYTLTDGPDGMRVSPSGKLTWVAPKEMTRETARAVVAVADASGREQFHALTIQVH